ncbi:hypothetical protein CJ030_MR2G000913 [Morella rubra]|uniref:Uncharacterized protein n=1 Tax=Morella rubra TaxID=262757 RepID=A0A6A1WGD2_9ROSI|nr:hypothetical protein CJ030_MR2G000913 [Morella rubra]
MTEYIETDQCIRECGVDRETVGISSDALFEPQFTAKLCSPPCYQECPNIVDLYFNLAAGEGVYLPYICERELTNPHRVMVEFMSFSNVADPGPDVSGGPSPAPVTSTSPAPAPL